MIDGEEHRRIRRLKEAAHMLGYSLLMSRPNVEINAIWEPLIKKVQWKKIAIRAKVKKSYMIVVSSISLVNEDISFISPQNSLWIVQQETWRGG